MELSTLCLAAHFAAYRDISIPNNTVRPEMFVLGYCQF